MDSHNPGSFPPGGFQPPPGKSFGQAGHPNQPPFGGGFGPANPNAYAPPNFGHNPYANPYGDPRFPQRPPPSGSRWWLWLLLGGMGMLFCLCCGGAALVYFGFNIIEQELTPQLENDPVVQEHIGEVQSVEFDFMKSIDENETGGDAEALVFRVEGTKGSGHVIGRSETGPDGVEHLTGGILRMPNGEEYQLSE